MNGPAFVAALAVQGLECKVEAREKLAIITTRQAIGLDARDRRAIVALGRAHGFANVCLELDAVNAPLSGD